MAAAFPFVLLGLGLLGLHELGAEWLALVSARCSLGSGWRSADWQFARHDDWLAGGLSAHASPGSCWAGRVPVPWPGCVGLWRRASRLRFRLPGGVGCGSCASAHPRAFPKAKGTEPRVQPACRTRRLTWRLPPIPTWLAPIMMQAVRGFNEQLERIAELVVVLIVGAMLPYAHLDWLIDRLSAAPVFCPASGVGVVRITWRFGFGRSASADFLVRHPGYRLSLLPDVRA
jgi:hypothetical protein